MFSKIKNAMVYALKDVGRIRSLRDLKINFDKIAFPLIRYFDYFKTNLKLPISLQIEPTNYCNVRCFSCPNAEMEREKGFMDMGLFIKIIDQAQQYGIKRIYLFLHGEPLLHPKLDEMLREIKRRNLYFTLTTNGTNLEKLLPVVKGGYCDLGDYVIVSVLGLTREEHSIYMKGANPSVIEDNVRLLFETKRKLKRKGPLIEVLTYINGGEKKYNVFIKRWRHIVDNIHPPGVLSKSFMRKGDLGGRKRNKPCKKFIWERMVIYWNGEVTICAQDVDGKYVIGDLRNESIKEIWNEAHYRYRRLHINKKWNDIPLCSSCDM